MPGGAHGRAAGAGGAPSPSPEASAPAGELARAVRCSVGSCRAKAPAACVLRQNGRLRLCSDAKRRPSRIETIVPVRPWPPSGAAARPTSLSSRAMYQRLSSCGIRCHRQVVNGCMEYFRRCIQAPPLARRREALAHPCCSAQNVVTACSGCHNGVVLLLVAAAG